MAAKKKVVFVCTGNAARSQMAEGFLRALYGDRYEVASAGIRPFRLSRTAARVMGEAGIDISGYRSKSVAGLGGGEFDVVVTLCDEAACVPRHLLPRGTRYLHHAFPDPAGITGSGEEAVAAFQDIRDRIGAWIREEFGPGGRVPGDGPAPGPRPAPDLQKT
jgi:arsenate reductase (thioredoxin)